jgi:hypothetical protein
MRSEEGQVSGTGNNRLAIHNLRSSAHCSLTGERLLQDYMIVIEY